MQEATTTTVSLEERELYLAELHRILASEAFAKTPRLSALLSHIVEHTLRGQLDELTEQQIGIHVFQRAPGYNSAEDTIVRGTARHLRQRLELYYSNGGRLDAVRLSVPKGGYVARFELVEAQPETSDAAVHDIPGQAPGWPISAKLVAVSLAVLAMALAVLLGVQRRTVPVAEVHEGPQKLWQALFTPGRKTLIVPGDASLDAYIAWEQRPVSLSDYTNQYYQQQIRVTRPPHGNDVPLAARSVTPMADLRLVSELVRVPQWMGHPELQPLVEIRYARDVAVGDTHDNNLILIGTESFDPWVTLYHRAMDFHAEWDFKSDDYAIVNSQPRAGEKARYEYVRTDGSTFPVAHIAFLNNSQGPGKVLIVEGTTMGTTYAAISFLKDEGLWRPVMDAATDRDGRLHNFEVLLAGDFVRGGISNVRRIAIHVH